MVRMKGLEPPRLSTLEPKSRASANFATSAKSNLKITTNQNRLICGDLFKLTKASMIIVCFKKSINFL